MSFIGTGNMYLVGGTSTCCNKVLYVNCKALDSIFHFVFFVQHKDFENMRQMIRTGSDPLGRYYTAANIGALLVQTMGLAKPSVVLDLGVGDGALVNEAMKIWQKSKFITVDIDSNIARTVFRNNTKTSLQHHVCDALDAFLSEKLGLPLGEADAAICNPPYIRPRWKKHFAEILEDAGLTKLFPKMTDVPADLLFIAQNLRFLKKYGKLGLIIPDGIVAGERFANFRKLLTEEHRVERVIELPRGVFKHTQAKAHILVLSKQAKSANCIEVQRISSEGGLSQAIKLPVEFAEKRLDYSYLIEKRNLRTRSKMKIADICELSTRGSYSSAEKKVTNFPVFHTSDFNEGALYVSKKFKLSNLQKAKVKGAIAQSGDILIARVGRNLSNKVCMVESGFVAVSDCVIILRIRAAYRISVYSILRSERGVSILNALSHGVGAQFITPNSLLNISI